jgi:hypothetical protein
MPQYKDPGKIEFDAAMIDAGGGGVYVEFPEDVPSLFGVKGRVPIKASFDGIPYRGSLVKMGTNCHALLVLKQIREALKKEAGDKIHVVVELDLDERKIELSADVKTELRKNPSAGEAWDKLSFTNKREFHNWIEEAKLSETRTNRIAQMIGKLIVGEKLRVP